MQNIFRSLPKVFEEFDESDAAIEPIVLAAWRKIAGEALNAHTIPLRVFKKRLWVVVANDTWKAHMQDLSGQMIFKLNSLLGRSQITFIEFYTDEKKFANRMKATDAISDAEFDRLAESEMSPTLKQAAQNISDEKLRKLFLLAAGGNLVRQKLNRKGR